MPLMLVTLVSVLVGVAVYLGTVRHQAQSATGFGEPQDETADQLETGTPPPGYAYLRVSTQAPGLRDRLQGLIGVVLLIGVAAAALALVLYELGHLVNRTIEAFLD